jgi:hypothetical protein
MFPEVRLWGVPFEVMLCLGWHVQSGGLHVPRVAFSEE